MVVPTTTVMALNATSGRPTTHLLLTALTKGQARGMRGLDVLLPQRNTLKVESPVNNLTTFGRILD
jgi:hypothetical protein